jgi:hypothetical protein
MKLQKEVSAVSMSPEAMNARSILIAFRGYQSKVCEPFYSMTLSKEAKRENGSRFTNRRPKPPRENAGSATICGTVSNPVKIDVTPIIASGLSQ